jgi:hypothetical protein
MRRVGPLLFVASLFSLSALLPVAALASTTTLTEYVVGVEYAVGSCSGGQTGSFAGYGSATQGGQANAVFNTSICHTPLTAGTASILPGGDFELATSSVALVGQYVSGVVGPGQVSPLFPGSKHFCKEVFPVAAALGPATKVPKDATNIADGTAMGNLTHVGVFAAGGGCHAFAATITGTAVLVY